MLKQIVFAILLLSVLGAPDWTELNNLFAQAIKEKAFPGGSVLVANATHTIYRNNYGHLFYDGQLFNPKVTNQTRYEIASITKIMATTFGVMILVDQNRLKLTDKVTKFFPEYGNNGKENTTVANLLQHNSGLKFDFPGPLPATPQGIWDYIANVVPDFPVGTKFQYSNLGMLVLGHIVEKASGKKFEQFFEENKQKAGFQNTEFNPPRNKWCKIAPTRYDDEVRHRIVRGETHERVAYFLGGAVGQCGLFSNVDDIARYLRLLLNGGKLPNERRVLSKQVVQLFTTRSTGLPYDNIIGYGFSTSCHGLKKLMKKCFGHDGSTGIMAWADPQKKIVFAITTNRSHPDVNNYKILPYMEKFADAIMDALSK